MNYTSKKDDEAGNRLLADASICASVPTANLKRTTRFHEETLGLKAAKSDEELGVYFESRGGTLLNLYERPHATTEQTVATFLVENIERVMSGLRSKEHNKPNLKTKDGVFSDASGFKASWLKDPDGNILGLEQLPAGHAGSGRP